MKYFTESKNTLTGKFEFKNFKHALDFINLVGGIAENYNHHPDMLLHDYKFVTISTTTHDLGNKITQKDRDLVQQIESFYNS